MKVVITHTDFRIYWPSRIAALQRALETRGDELHVIEIAGAGSPYAFSGNDGMLDTPVRHWSCLFPSARMEDLPPARASRALLARLDELSPDIVLAGSIAYPSGATAVYWAKYNHRPVVIFDDARLRDVPRNSLVNYIKQRIYEQVDAVLCPAAPWTETFTQWNFSPRQLFFGVDVVDNDFWNKDPGGCISALPVPYLLAVGRHIPAKNFLFLLKAYESYQTQCRQPLSLVIVGEGPEREALENFINDRGLQRVHLFPFVNQQTLRVFYHHAAALVLPSRSETWGLVVNEAMAAGLPVLVSRACGCAEVLVREGVNGITFSPEEMDELVNALLTFTNIDPVKRAAMGRASGRIIRPWGLDQFVRGSLHAIDYAIENKKICRSLPARMILRHWKGRYRPV